MNREKLASLMQDLDTKSGGYLRFSDLAALALETCLPEIEADLREQIAREIEARDTSQYTIDACAAYRSAARIVREGGTPE